MKHFPLFILLALIFASCASSKMTQNIAAHNLRLSSAANSDLNAEDKIDVLGETLASLMDETLKYTNAKNAVRYVQTFEKKNEKALDALLKSVDQQMKTLSTGEKITFAARILQKPYTKQIFDSLPKVERKIQRRVRTFLFLSKALKTLNPLG